MLLARAVSPVLAVAFAIVPATGIQRRPADQVPQETLKGNTSIFIVAAQQGPAAPTAEAANLTGDWDLTISLDSPLVVRADLKQESDKISGSLSSDVIPQPVQISDGKIKGHEFTFAVVVPDQGGSSYTATFTGTVTGDAIRGKVAARDMTLDFDGKRKQASGPAATEPSNREKEEQRP